MEQFKDPPKVRPIVDGITGVLVLSMVVGLPLVGWFYHCGMLPFWITIVLRYLASVLDLCLVTSAAARASRYC